MKAVHTAGTEVEAIILQGLLEEAGIPVMVRSRELIAYGEIVELAAGWGDLLVPDAQAAEARDLIAGYLASVERDGRP